MKNSTGFFFKAAAAIFLTFGSLLLFLPSSQAQAPAGINLQQAGYYRMQVGEFEVTAISDGTIPQDAIKLLMHAGDGEIDRLLKLGFLTSPVETSVNAYLIKAGGRLILVDAGTADAFGPSLGLLTRSLNNAGYKPEQIDAILITHIHPDHVGGLMDGDRMVFPNATIYLSGPELAFWLGEEGRKKAPEALKFYFQNAEQKVGPYLKAGRVRTFQYGGELFPGIRPVASPGHTPGHSFYVLESKGQKLLFWGDILHVAAVQLKDPSITIQYDIDPEAAMLQRKKAFAEAAGNGYWVAGDHIPIPGIGHLKAEGKSYSWVPVNYSTYGSGQ